MDRNKTNISVVSKTMLELSNGYSEHSLFIAREDAEYIAEQLKDSVKYIYPNEKPEFVVIADSPAIDYLTLDDKIPKYKFVYSYKHGFVYTDGKFNYIIQGDIYRDNFEPTMTERTMGYFESLEHVSVTRTEIEG